MHLVFAIITQGFVQFKLWAHKLKANLFEKIKLISIP